jgi:hypothetical protein
MSAADLVIVIVAVVSLATIGVLVGVVVAFRRAIVELRRTLAHIRDEVIPAVNDLQDASARAVADMERVDGLVAQAESVQARADKLSRITYRAVAGPVIRTAAVLKGTSHATRRIRRAGGKQRLAG